MTLFHQPFPTSSLSNGKLTNGLWMRIIFGWQTCCGLGDPMTAVRALSDKGMGFYRTKVVPPDTFNYLLTQLYMNGSIESESMNVTR